MQIFDRISSLIDADDCQAAIEDARALLLQFGQKSDALTHAIDEFLLDLMTLAFIVECYGRGFELLARTLARRRLAKVRLLSGGVGRAERVPKPDG
ncbi:hypothetical protein X727_05230 [Mesorhizobium sp. L103C119B0]|uniref:hypothetical protein n=1 Tax=Mesorhizobium sp. M0387 TaxID=2956940 RepID=UPI0003CE20F4|nr:hypothetical protein X768_17235 [Mesorhizobium sp. LSJC265A00]ESZ56019.1 hypothetical protein X728_25780 [Mesorhizobium sp. L103C120A0]ESZ71845.1 hypothetical protein X727_05230 [Mesorhizobium sp. L103C119B0]